MAPAAVILAGLAAALLAGGRPDLLRTRLGVGRPPGAASPGGYAPGGGVNRAMAGAAAAVAATTAVGGPVLGVAVVVGLALVIVLRDRRGRARLRRRRESDAVEACLALAADLRAGVPVRRALESVAADWPELFAPAAGRAAVGADVVSALREEARKPGAAALAAVAAGWEVSERTGAALASVLVAVADSLRADAAVRREAESQLAAVRATSWLLALLPVGTLLLLSGGGGAPLRFLTGSPYGLACLGTAAALVGLGLWWIDRLARSAVKSVWAG
jgi:tight adherence protein B